MLPGMMWFTQIFKVHALNLRVDQTQKFMMIPLVFSSIYTFSFMVFGLYLEFEFSYFSHIVYPPTEKLSLRTVLASVLHEAAVKAGGGYQWAFALRFSQESTG